MAARERAGGAYEIGFESHGVRVALEASDENLLASVAAWLPRGARTCPAPVEPRFGIWTEEKGSYRIEIPGQTSARFRDRDLAIGTLQRRLAGYVAAEAEDQVPIHAAAVAYRGRAILIPGYSHSGKTTLAQALVEAGATLYSDEYAVLDLAGWVHPYPQPLSVRDDAAPERIRWPKPGPEAEPGGDPVAVGVVAITNYRAGARWDPKQRSTGSGVAALLAHSLSAMERPSGTLAAIKRAVDNALVLEGERGEAGVAAEALIESVQAHARAGSPLRRFEGLG